MSTSLQLCHDLLVPEARKLSSSSLAYATAFIIPLGRKKLGRLVGDVVSNLRRPYWSRRMLNAKRRYPRNYMFRFPTQSCLLLGSLRELKRSWIGRGGLDVWSCKHAQARLLGFP
jgi:hypothetical protein